MAGVIVNQHEERTVSGQAWLDELDTAAQTRGLPVLTPPIPKRVVISDATEATALGALYSAHLASIEGDPS